jgi:hypothetical protein
MDGSSGSGRRAFPPLWPWLQIVAPLIRRPAACPVATFGRNPAVATSGRARTPLIRFGEFMAKKTRKQKQRTATRRPGTPAPAAPSVATRQMAAPAPLTPRAQPRVLPESVLPLPGTELEIESEPDDEPAEDVIAAVESSTRRRVERVNPAAQPRPIRGQQSAAAMFLPLDSDDAAIPFDRVPYVPRDLRRVAIMASLMIVLILIAAFVVTRFNL